MSHNSVLYRRCLRACTIKLYGLRKRRKLGRNLIGYVLCKYFPLNYIEKFMYNGEKFLLHLRKNVL